MHPRYLVVIVKKILKIVYIYESYCKIKTEVSPLGPPCKYYILQ